MSSRNQISKRSKYGKISNEKRESLINLVMEEGESITKAANLMKMKFHTARTIIANYKATGAIDQKPKGGKGKTILSEAVMMKIEELISINPEYSLKELQTRLQDNGYKISLSSICRSLQSLKITRKMCHRELDRVNESLKIQQRKEYALWFNNNFDNDYSKAVFVDECSFNLHLKRSFARSKIGTRAVVRTPTVRGRSITLIASMLMNGMGFCKTITNSTVNSSIFNDYLKSLCEYMRDVLEMHSGCIIMDNARVHRKEDIENITTQFGFTYKFLAPYSYMLNPIENGFSKIKNGVRSRLRLEQGGLLSDLVMMEVSQVTSTDCSGFFRYILKNITNCAAELPYVHQ